MGGRPASRTLTQPQLPTELQEGTENAYGSTKPSLFVCLGFFFTQVDDVDSDRWNPSEKRDILQ